MFINLKSALIHCHKSLIKGGHYYFAFALFQFMRGNETYSCSAIQAITFFSKELITKDLI